MSVYDKIVRPTTQMLLKRMDDYPEDFDANNTGLSVSRSWLSIVKHGSFNWYERSLINKKTKTLRRKATEQAILGLLLDGQARQEEPDSNIYQHTTVGRFSGQERMRLSSDGSLGIGGKFVVPTIKIGSETLTEEDLRAIKKRVKRV